ncbi:MAG: hypothetical protein FWE15_24400, partial [Actinomycetia bacterium]|nr:hypothetical protein [Actinomycetes bacterium]
MATGTPAHAATRLTLAADTPVSLAAGLGGQPGPATDLRAWASGPGLEPGARIQVRADVSGLAGLATVAWPAGCTPDGAGTAALCDVPAVPHPDDPGLVLSLRAAPGVPEGKGTVTFTGVSDNVAGRTATSSVDVVGGPVALDGMPVRVSARPGDAVPLPFRLANYGAQAPDGEILELIPSHGLDIVGRSSGCGYEEGKDGHATWIVCYLGKVPSGRTIDYGHAVTFTATASSLIEDVEAHVYPDTPETRDRLAREHHLTPGTGPALAPDGSSEGVPAAAPVTWADPKIDVDNVADLSVGTPSPRTAAKGATLDIRLAVTNHGPADYIDAWNENPAAWVEFVPPPGTTVTGFTGDTGCVMLAADDRTVVSGRDRTRPGDRVTCPTAAYFLHGVTLHPVVKLRIDKVVPNATGK